jgi:excisionase family DNA binding protein
MLESFIQPLLTTRQVARLFQVSPRKIRAKTRAGHLPAVRLGRTVRYSIPALHKFIGTVTCSGEPTTFDMFWGIMPRKNSNDDLR